MIGQYNSSYVDNKDFETMNVDFYSNKELIKAKEVEFSNAKKNKKKIPIEEELHELKLKQINLMSDINKAKIKPEDCVNAYEYQASLCGVDIQKYQELLKLYNDRYTELSVWEQKLRLSGKKNKQRHIKHLDNTIVDIKVEIQNISNALQKTREQALMYVRQYQAAMQQVQTTKEQEKQYDNQTRDVKNNVATLSPQEVMTNKDIFR